MSNELDTSWFDLKKYDNLKYHGINEWYGEIFVRQCYWYTHCEKNDINRIKENPIFGFDGYSQHCKKYSSNYSFNTLSVESTTAFDFLKLSEHDKLKKEVWSLFRVYTDEAQKIIDTPINLLYKEKCGDFPDFTYVTVDLNATNEQIIKDFKHWLIEYRKFTDYTSKKKNFTKINFSDWIDYRLLPYIDLMLISEFEKKKITQEDMANIIFYDYLDKNKPDKEILDRLKKSTIPKANWLLEESTLDIIRLQTKMVI